MRFLPATLPPSIRPSRARFSSAAACRSRQLRMEPLSPSLKFLQFRGSRCVLSSSGSLAIPRTRPRSISSLSNQLRKKRGGGNDSRSVGFKAAAGDVGELSSYLEALHAACGSGSSASKFSFCGSGFQPRSSRQDAAPTEKKPDLLESASWRGVRQFIHKQVLFW
jgi:hypothetical protein